MIASRKVYKDRVERRNADELIAGNMYMRPNGDIILYAGGDTAVLLWTQQESKTLGKALYIAASMDTFIPYQGTIELTGDGS